LLRGSLSFIAALFHLAAAEGAESAATRWTPAAISTDQYESTPTFSPDGTELVFMSSDPKFSAYRLLSSRCVAGQWSPPVPPSFALQAPVHDADPSFTPDGKRLFFISTRQNLRAEDEDFDIWFVDRSADGRWSLARRLPAPVNSDGSELLPRATADGRLFFGSDRPGGHGKGDIYVATATSDQTWRVENVGPPVSTEAFEYEAEISRDVMIVVADRGDRSHLYRFELSADGWRERGRIPARPDVFQVGPLLSPAADRLLFSQAHGEQSGELFLIDLVPSPDRQWPPSCKNR